MAPENTLPAFQAAIDLGADGVELGVQYSSDGKLVVIHNPMLDATTDGVGRVSARTSAELRRARQAGPEIQYGLLLAPDLPGWTRWGIVRRHSRADSLHPELKMVDAAYVAAAHARAMPVRVWTVNEEADMRRMIALGVDAIITDAPDVLAALIQHTINQQRS